MTAAQTPPSPSIKDQVSAAEWQTRVDLAACYRLIALYGWDDLIFTHISAKVPGTEDFLINPYGMMFHEITASSLVKVDLAGNKLMDSPYDINPAGYTIHSAIHEVRQDVGCVLHIHTPAGIAVSAQKQACCRSPSNPCLCSPAWPTTATKAWPCTTRRRPACRPTSAAPTS